MRPHWDGAQKGRIWPGAHRNQSLSCMCCVRNNVILRISHARSFLDNDFAKGWPLLLKGSPCPVQGGFASRSTVDVWCKEMRCFRDTKPREMDKYFSDFSRMYLRSKVHLTLGLSPWPYRLNIKCIKALYLESHMPFLGNSPSSTSDFIGSTMQIVFIIY